MRSNVIFRSMAILGCLVSIQLFSFKSEAREGGIAGGGGDGFVCSGNGREAVYLADIYDLVIAGHLNRFGDNQSFLEWTADTLEARYPEKMYPHPFIRGERVSFGELVYHTSINLIWNRSPDPTQDMRDFPDDYIKSVDIPLGCQKVQLALQDLQTGIITTSRRASNLSRSQWDYLILHEALIRIRNQPGADTTPIRHRVNEIARFLSDPKGSLRALVIEASRSNQPKQSVGRAQLAQMPHVLECRLTSVSPTVAQSPLPTRFQVVRIEGSGAEGVDSRYELRLANGGSSKSLENVWDRKGEYFSKFQVEPTNSDYSKVNFSFDAVFDDAGSRLELYLADFYPRTRDFLGSIRVRKPYEMKVFGPTPDLTINCFAMSPQFLAH